VNAVGMEGITSTSKTETIPRDECLSLLQETQLVRVLISVRCLPVALPVRFAVLNQNLSLLASSDPSVLLAAQHHDVLTVQIDGIDPKGQTWLVVSSGLASIVSPPPDLPDYLKMALEMGHSLISLPLSVLVGQRG
jgi:nitroimidazol reductase NimA-like FMN-containing flavoprotein (pyridoxamine 5'-phosphate oxidase superfamily)